MKRLASIILGCIFILFVSCSEKPRIENPPSDGKQAAEEKPITSKPVGCKGANSPNLPNNHEPPIGNGKGSSFFDLTNRQRLTLLPSKETHNKIEYFVYRIDSVTATYTHIECISIFTEDRVPDFRVVQFTGNEAYEATLKLWLGDTPGNADPQITPFDFMIRCNDKNAIKNECYLLALDTLPIARSSANYKKVRPQRYSRSKFVIKWLLNDNLGDEDDDMYYVHVAFGHVDKKGDKAGAKK